MQTERLKQVLKNNGYSVSTPRRIIFETLKGSSPQTIDEIIKRLAGKVDRATVYRTIDLFEKINVVHRVHIGWKYKLELSDLFVNHHHHMQCLKCGSILTFNPPRNLENTIRTIATAAGFSHTSHQLEVYGLCSQCSSKS